MAIGPIDYSTDVQTPFQAALQGYQAGAAIRDDQTKQQQAETARQQQLQMQQDLAGLYSNPTPRAIAQMSLKYPQFSEQFKRSSDMLNEEQRRSQLASATPIYAAVLSGNNELASAKVREQADAMANSGQEGDAKHMRVIADLIDKSPETAKIAIGSWLSGLMGPDKFADTFTKLGEEQRAAAKAPAELTAAEAAAEKAKADAETAKVTAKYADNVAMTDLQKRGWDIRKIASDIEIDKQQARIAAMNASLAREANDLKRQELKLKVDEAKQKLDDKIREKVSTAEAGASSIDNMLNTIERIKKNPALNAVVGSIEGGRFYPQTLAGMLPGTVNADERADAMALIETLGSQAFVAQIPNIKGTGALSDAEGKKLQSALTNLSREQSEKQFRENLDEAMRLLTKGRETLSRSTGVPLGKPDTPAAPGARPPLSSFQR